MPGVKEKKFDLAALCLDWLRRQGVPVGERKKLLILAFLLCLGVVLMLWAGKAVLPDQRISPEPVASVPGREKEGEFMGKTQLEVELSTVLSRIKGVGQVKVTLVPAESTKEHWLYKETTEERTNQQDNGIITREKRIQKEPVFRRGSGGVEEPVRILAEAPVIAGVLVVAEGAEDAVTCRRLWEAAATALGIPIHRVMVLPWGE